MTKVSGMSVPWYEVERDNVRYNQTIPPSMILEKDGKIQYCPNAKAGTTTVEMTLQIQRCYPKWCNRTSRNAFWGEASKRDIILNERTITFTHVRNPWDRIWSTYKGKILSGKFLIPPFTKESPPTFAQFLDHVEKFPDSNLH